MRTLTTTALLAALLAAGGLARPAAAQDGAERPDVPSAFRAGVELVALDVCVKDQNGRLLTALGGSDFHVFEDGVEQDVAYFTAAGRVPLAAVLLIDRSASMHGSKLDRARESATRFIQALGPEDLVGVVAFNHDAERVVPLGGHRTAALAAVDGLRGAFGSTGLHEAVLVALGDLQRLRSRAAGELRYALIILSDGEDTTGRIAFDEVVRAVRRSQVIVYGVSVLEPNRDNWAGAGYALTQWAIDTGGRAVSAKTPQSLGPILAEIGEELRHLYRLGYVPTNGTRDGRWREVAIRVTEPTARARSRRGYYAPRPSILERLGRPPAH